MSALPRLPGIPQPSRRLRWSALLLLFAFILFFVASVAVGALMLGHIRTLEGNVASANFGDQRALVFGWALTFLAFAAILFMTAFFYYRFEGRRAQTASELLRLNAELSLLSQVASRTENMVLICDPKSNILWANPAFAQMTGYTADQIVGQRPIPLLRGPATEVAAIDNLVRALQHGDALKVELLAYTQAGQEYWADLQTQPVRDEVGKLTHLIIMLVNINEQRRRERQFAKNSHLLDVINRAQNEFIMTKTPDMMFEDLLGSLLDLTDSEYGFIGEVLRSETGEPYLKTHAITNIAWSPETRRLYESQASGGMEFHNLRTLFGAAIMSQEPVITNDPGDDPRRGGMPHGHPTMHGFLGAPFFNARGEMVGLVGIANRPGGYDQALVDFLHPFLATCGNLIEAYRNEHRRQAAEATLVTLNAELERHWDELTVQRDFAMQVMNNMGQGLTVVDEHGRFTFVNPAFAQMLNEAPENLIGRLPDEYIVAVDLAALTEARRVRAQGQSSIYEIQLKRDDGQIIDVLVTGVPRYRQGVFAGSIAVITNLTPQKQVEMALRRSEAEARKLSQVASRTNNMVVITDAAGRTEWQNEAFSRVTGYALAETAGRRLRDILSGPETDREAIELIARKVQAGQGFKRVVQFYTKAGEPYWVELGVEPVHDEEGVLTNFIGIHTDITERQAAEKHLRAAKEVAEQTALAKAAFLASMSHEIRTPLNAVIGLNSLLLNTSLTDEQRRFAETARNSGNLLLMLLHNVLDFSSFEAGRVELEQRPFGIDACLREITDLLRHQAQEKGLALRYDIADDVAPVLVGDVTRLSQILINLVGNSVKFTESGAVVIKVTVHEADDPLHEAGDPLLLHFQVIDTGIGIPADRLDRLFQPFAQVDASTTRRYGGTGLGLVISKMIVQLMGGEISVASRQDEGTTFRFTVQLSAADPQTPLPHDSGQQIDRAMGQKWPLNILIVEDDAVNQQVALHMLNQLGYSADIAANGHEALAAMKRRLYHVVLMDVRMPDMDGPTTTKRIHATWPVHEVPYIIAMTASALEGDRERLLAEGMDAYLSKPIVPQAMAAVLSAAIEDRRRRLAYKNARRAAPPIDEDLFRQRLGAGHPDLLGRLVGLFIEEAQATLPLLEQALANGQAHEVSRLAHKLRGSAGSASAIRFAELAATLESWAEADNLAEAPHLVAQLTAELTHLYAWQATATAKEIV